MNHGCLGLHFAFNRWSIYRRLKFLLFAIALLVPVLSALGFVTLGRELIDSPIAAAAAYDYLSPSHAADRAAIEYLRDVSLSVYFVLVGAVFTARAIRNQIERGRKRLISISYPIRTVSVPRGWTVLEASRAFHIPHAAMCGGQARCSTCRVRVTAGEKFCPPPKEPELATLHQIQATRDIRLGCQLRPRGSISVVPLVQIEQRNYRPITPRRSTEREIACLYCDFLNRPSLAENNLPPRRVLCIYASHRDRRRCDPRCWRNAQLCRNRQYLRVIRSAVRVKASCRASSKSRYDD